MTIIEVKNDELLGRTNDGVIAVKFYAMQKQIDDLQKENEELKEKIKKYEDPEDLKLMFMYCDEKAKDKIKELQENYERIYNENCILRDKHNINDIGLLDENYKLKQVIDKAILRGE